MHLHTKVGNGMRGRDKQGEVGEVEVGEVVKAVEVVVERRHLCSSSLTSVTDIRCLQESLPPQVDVIFGSDVVGTKGRCGRSVPPPEVGRSIVSGSICRKGEKTSREGG